MSVGKVFFFQNDKSNTSGVYIFLLPRERYWVYDDWLWPWKYNYFHRTENAIYSFLHLGQVEGSHADPQKWWEGTRNSIMQFCRCALPADSSEHLKSSWFLIIMFSYYWIILTIKVRENTKGCTVFKLF